MSMHAPLIDADARVPAFPPIAAREARLWTAQELADRWRVSKAQVYRLAREGRVPTVWIGRYCRFSPSAIEAFEASQGGRADG